MPPPISGKKCALRDSLEPEGFKRVERLNLAVQYISLCQKNRGMRYWKRTHLVVSNCGTGWERGCKQKLNPNFVNNSRL